MITTREKEIISLVAQEYNSKEIAAMLYISEHTVVSHRKNIQNELGVKNTAGMIRKSFEMGILRTSTLPQFQD